MDLLDWCQGPNGAGCEFIHAHHDTPAVSEGQADTSFVGHCPTCRFAVEVTP